MSDEPATDPLESARRWLSAWYQVPVLALLFAFMVWVRQRSWERFTTDGHVYLSGNDPWYHLRMVQYTVRHWPATIPYDVWTGFAAGKDSGQFGTLFDQAIATVALILGLGDPSQQLVRTVVAFAPVVIGSLVVIPTYLIGRRIGGRITGVLAALVLSLLPGLFLSRSLVGAADHNIAEPLMMSIAVFGLMAMLATAERERPIWEQVLAREVGPLRSVLASGTLAGVAIGLYLYVWPPGVLLIGVFGVFVLVKMTSDVVDDVSPEHVAIPSVIAMFVTGIMALARIRLLTFTATGFSLLQVLFPLAVAAGAIYVSWLAREFEARDVDGVYFPWTIAGSVLAGVVVVAVAIPSLYRMVASNLLRFVGFSAGAATRTIGEAQPFPLSMAQQYGLSQTEVLFHEYAFAFFLAIAALGLILVVPLLRSDDGRRITRDTRKIGLAIALPVVTGLLLQVTAIQEFVGSIFAVDPTIVGIAIVGTLLAATMVVGSYDPERLFLAVWTIFMLAAAFTQVRFNYYFAVPVAILAAYLPVFVLDLFSISIDLSSLEAIDVNTVLTVATVLLLLVAPLAVPVGLSTTQGKTIEKRTAWQVGNGAGPGAVTVWDGALDWMQRNTPAEGNYGGAGNAGELDYYGTYAQPPDGNFDYPDGAYGVMSWWDYGHWITVLGDRIPVANPFQQHATVAANYLLAPNETQAQNVLQRLDEPDASTRYVMIDWQMMQGKFGAPTVFYDAQENVSLRDFQRTIYRVNEQTGSIQRARTINTQRYYTSQMVRLYKFHGSAVNPAPIVVDWDVRRVQTPQGPIPIRVVPESGKLFRTNFSSLAAAEQFVRNDTTSQIGGVGDYPVERVPALEHYRQVKVAQPPAAQGSNYAVKVFERVPGATVTGTGPANATVTARVQLHVPTTGKNFTYTHYAQTGPDGTWTMTLPYSTTGYDEWGVKAGYTNVSVRATGPYRFSTGLTMAENMTVVRYTATANVSEAAVIGEDTTPLTVDLERRVLDRPEGATNETATNATDGGTNATSGQTNATEDPTTNATPDETTTTTNAALTPIERVAPRA